MRIDLEQFRKNASGSKQANKKLLDKLKQNPPRNLDQLFHEFHEEAFEEIDCLTCANCCKTTGPLFLQKDIERLAGHFRIKPAEFIAKYLHVDEEGDYILNTLPCPFLGEDNYCKVYDDRPNACREYPHTNRRKIHTIFKETLNNSLICPAVLQILHRMEGAVRKNQRSN